MTELLKLWAITRPPCVLLSRYQFNPSGAHTPILSHSSPFIHWQYGSMFCRCWHTCTFIALSLCCGQPLREWKWSQFLPSWQSLCHLLSKTHRSIIGVSWRGVFGWRQITAGCQTGSSVALLSAEKNAVNADKHCTTGSFTTHPLNSCQYCTCSRDVSHSQLWDVQFTHLQILSTVLAAEHSCCIYISIHSPFTVLTILHPTIDTDLTNMVLSKCQGKPFGDGIFEWRT